MEIFPIVQNNFPNSEFYSSKTEEKKCCELITTCIDMESGSRLFIFRMLQFVGTFGSDYFYSSDATFSLPQDKFDEQFQVIDDLNTFYIKSHGR